MPPEIAALVLLTVWATIPLYNFLICAIIIAMEEFG